MKTQFTKSVWAIILLLASAGAMAQEKFVFEITTTEAGQSFAIPLSGGNGGKSYNWNINWGDSSTSLNQSGTGSQTHAGIPHTYNSAGTYTITITPAGSTDAWLAAFGFYYGTSGANARANKNKVTKVVSPVTPLMTRRQTQIDNPSNTQPHYEWYYTFYECSNLTMGADFTFSGWGSVTTTGSYFAYRMFSYCNSADFTMNSVFNLPQGIINTGAYFASDMFEFCQGANFAMNDVFNLPQGITSIGNGFAYRMFYACNGANFTMNSVFNLPPNITSAGNQFAYAMFGGCRSANFTMNSVFNLPQGITRVGDEFVYDMFYGCSGANFTMNSIFNLPPNITSVGGGFAEFMFSVCSGANFTMNEVFNLPQKLTSVGSAFAYQLFRGCSGANFTMNEVINLPKDITSVGDAFAESMFSGCRGANFAMNEVFNLPQKIINGKSRFAKSIFDGCNGLNFTMNPVFTLPQSMTSADSQFGYGMFWNCTGENFTMNEVFNLPQNITSVGDEFAYYLFYACSGANFTMNEVFNLPQSVTNAGNSFAGYMFQDCSGANFTMNGVFNLPQNITSMGNSFAGGIFRGCSGANFTMNEVFNLPQSITSVGNSFASGTFANCSGSSFTMNEVFNLPPNITSVGNSFASTLFSGCSGASFKVNDVFKFPVLTVWGDDWDFEETFRNLGNASTQTRTAASIINGNSVPDYDANTFAGSPCFADLPYIARQWGGEGIGVFSEVTNITNVPTLILMGASRTLTATVVPSYATNKEIVWSIKDTGNTGATITNGNKLNATGEGIITVTATIANGLGEGMDYTKDFDIHTTTTIDGVIARDLGDDTITNCIHYGNISCGNETLNYRYDDTKKEVSVTRNGGEPETTAAANIDWTDIEAVVEYFFPGAEIETQNSTDYSIRVDFQDLSDVTYEEEIYSFYVDGELVVIKNFYEVHITGTIATEEFGKKWEVTLNCTGTGITLSQLSVSEGTLNPAFSPAVYNYTVDVAYSVSSINITATPTSQEATISGDTGTLPLNVGANPFTITVTEDEKPAQNYTITVNRANETGISETEAGKIKIYPNPVKDELTIENGELRIEKITIADLSGKTIQQINGSQKQINVSALSSDIYFLKIETDKGVVTRKFIKE